MVVQRRISRRNGRNLDAGFAVTSNAGRMLFSRGDSSDYLDV